MPLNNYSICNKVVHFYFHLKVSNNVSMGECKCVQLFCYSFFLFNVIIVYSKNMLCNNRRLKYALQYIDSVFLNLLTTLWKNVFLLLKYWYSIIRYTVLANWMDIEAAYEWINNLHKWETTKCLCLLTFPWYKQCNFNLYKPNTSNTLLALFGFKFYWVSKQIKLIVIVYLVWE